MTHDIAVLGIFAADVAFRAARLPNVGETLLGDSFALNAGGKGSNQAVAAARAGGAVAMLSKIGQDTFGDLAVATWTEAGVHFSGDRVADAATGAAFIFVDSASGDNAIIVAPGAAGTISTDDIERWRAAIEGAKVFICQLEQPLVAAERALSIAHDAGVRTILNPAPAAELSDAILAMCDLVTPNESEAQLLTGIEVTSVGSASAAARALIQRGVGEVVVTLGENGAFWTDGTDELHIKGLSAGDVIETTGAGDAFNGGLAVALSEGKPIGEALRFANATAAISVTRAGAAPAMPVRDEIERLLQA